jgi:Flp pilus assembly protein TadG
MLKRVSGTRSRERSESAESKSPPDSGAAMVEMAFIFSILVMLLVGVVTSAIAFGQKNSIENSAREASRYAATYPVPLNNPEIADWNQWLEKVRDVAQAAAQGNLDTGVDGYYICVAHTGSGQRLIDTNGTEDPTPGTCYNDGLSDSRVQVVSQRDSQISAAFFTIDVTLRAPATARYERAE